jgi:hypothetical protein
MHSSHFTEPTCAPFERFIASSRILKTVKIQITGGSFTSISHLFTAIDEAGVFKDLYLVIETDAMKGLKLFESLAQGIRLVKSLEKLSLRLDTSYKNGVDRILAGIRDNTSLLECRLQLAGLIATSPELEDLIRNNGTISKLYLDFETTELPKEADLLDWMNEGIRTMDQIIVNDSLIVGYSDQEVKARTRDFSVLHKIVRSLSGLNDSTTSRIPFKIFERIYFQYLVKEMDIGPVYAHLILQVLMDRRSLRVERPAAFSRNSLYVFGKKCKAVLEDCP